MSRDQGPHRVDSQLWFANLNGFSTQAHDDETREKIAEIDVLGPNAPVAGNGLVQDLVVPGNRLGHRCWGVLPPLRRGHDIGEQERDRAGRQSETSGVRAAHFVHQQTPDRRIDLTRGHGVSIRDLDH